MKDIGDERTFIANKLAKHHKEVAKTLGLEVEKVKMDKNKIAGRFFKVTKKEGEVLSKYKAWTVIETRRDGTKFRTPDLEEISKKMESIAVIYDKKQSQIAAELIADVTKYLPQMDILSSIFGELDIFVSFSQVAANAAVPYIRPCIKPMGTGNIVLKESRHPCVELQENVNFITNDVELGVDGARFLVITGPNMGGKSTYIRQTGLITLMAQIGCFVPCSEAVDKIMTRIGANDSQMKGVSTFMQEMLETSPMLKKASKNSLLIIDELGRGTSTSDGYGIAWAISEQIAKKIGCFCLFATHFHELTLLEQEVPNVKNIHVEAYVGDAEIALLYKVSPGPCDKSFGINIAEMTKFPQEIIELAKLKAKLLEAAPSTASSDTLRNDAEEFIQSIQSEFKSLGGKIRLDSLKQLKKMIQEESTKNPFLATLLQYLNQQQQQLK